MPTSYGIRPEVDQSTGALTYRYPLTLPPGRSGMTPELTLQYSSQDRREGSAVGLCWDISLPRIDRQNLTGIENFYTDDSFISSLSGPLVRVLAGNDPYNFAARVDGGSLIRYTYSTVTDSWTATTKSGTVYRFGTTAQARFIEQGGNPEHIAAWLLAQVEDPNGNRIDYTYFHDASPFNQIYLDTVSYTNTAAGQGPFLVTFVRESRPSGDQPISYATRFRVETRYRVSAIEARVSGQLAMRYALGYAESAATGRSILTSIAQTGYDSAGVSTSLPPVSFAYAPGAMGFSEVVPNPLQGNELRQGYLFADVNGDGYSDLVQSYQQEGSNPERNVWLNNGNGNFVASTTWTGFGDPFCYFNSSQILQCQSQGTALFDVSGDLLPDYVGDMSGQPAPARLNLGNSWEVAPTGPTMPSLTLTANYRPSVAEFDGADIPEVQQISVGGQFNTSPVSGNRMADVNRDGLADAVRSAGDPLSSLGLDEGVYLNNGQNNFVLESAIPFLNGTNIGATAPSANAIFEQVNHKDAFLADVNGDDLPDAYASGDIRKRTGAGWGPGTSIPVVNEFRETYAMEWDGDGLLDLVLNDCTGELLGTPNSVCTLKLFRNTGSPPDILQTITLPAGGTIAAQYKAATAYKDGAGALMNPNLPFPVWTVERIIETDPVTSTSGITTYAYAGGRYHSEGLQMEHTIKRRFAGFSEVTATEPDASKTVSYFNTVDDTKIGKRERADTLAPGGTLLGRALTFWQATSTMLSATTTRFLTVPEKTVTLAFGAGGAYRASAESASYSATGALLTRADYGEVAAPDPLAPAFTDTGSDLRATTYTYATDAAGVLELPATEMLVNSASTTVRTTRTYYDNLPLGQVGVGNPTKTEVLTDTSAGTYAATTRAVNSYGLVTSETNPLNHTTSYAYDALNLYPATVTNALSQATSYTYDYSSGTPLTTTDPNGELRTTVLDGLDRVVEELAPHPETGAAFKTRSFAYTNTPQNASVLETRYLSGDTPPQIAVMYAVDLERDVPRYLSTADSSWFLNGMSELTIEAWVKLETQPSGGAFYAIASRWDAVNQRAYAFSYDGARLILAVSGNGQTSVGPTITLNAPIPVGEWHHVAVTYRSGSGETRFYLDGAQVSTPVNVQPTPIYQSTAPFEIGSQGAGVNAFDGLMDEVRVWSVARTAQELGVNMNVELNSLPGGTLRGVWHLNSALADASGHNNTLANNGGAIFVLDVPFGASPAAPMAPHTHTYLDGFGRAIQARAFDGSVGTSGLPNYRVRDARYDSQGRVFKSSLPYASAGSSRTPLTTQPALLTTYGYDGIDRVVSATDILGVTSTSYDRWDETITDPNSHPKAFGRDAFARLIRVDEFASQGTPVAVTAYEYNAAGNLTKVTDALGNIRSFTYDARGLRKTAQDLHAPSDATFGTHTFTYDLAGNLTNTIKPDATTITYAYDVLNRPMSEDWSGGAGVETAYTYDTCTRGIGRKCSEARLDWSESLAYDFAGNVQIKSSTIAGVPFQTSYAYDPQGNMRRETHPDGSLTYRWLNAAGEPATVDWKASAGSATTSVVTAMRYGPTGAAVEVARANGLTEVSLYDPNARYRLAQRLVVPSAVGTDVNTGSIDLESLSSDFLSAAAPIGSSLDITADLTLETWVKLESQPDPGTYRRIISKCGGTAAQQAYALSYRENAGVKQIEFLMSSGSGNTAQTLNYTLSDGLWYHLAAVYTASLGEVKVFVDGTLIGTMVGFYTSLPSVSANVELGAIQSAGTFDGLMDDVRVWESARTAEEIQANRSIEVDSAPNLRASWHLDGASTGYDDASGNGNTLSNSTSASFTTDAPFPGMGAGQEALPSRTYTYDPVGNVLSLIEDDASATTTATSTYQYDWLDRLTSSTVTTVVNNGPPTQTVTTYTYDVIGNLLTKTVNGNPASYLYGDGYGSSYANPHAVAAATLVEDDSDALQTFSYYDPNGNLLLDPIAATTNTWNFRNELKTSAKGANPITYGYNSAGLRISETVNGVTTVFPTPAFSAQGATSTIVLFVAGMPIATVQRVGAAPAEVFAIHTDHLQSARLATNQSGEVVESTDYDAFGKIISHFQSPTSHFTERKKFTSHEYDEGTSYTYAKARYLNTEVGRFVSQDPKFINNPEKFLEDPQQMNSYTYARNNPIKFKYVDPNGESATLVGAAGRV